VTAFDMTPPTAEQRRQITTGLNEQERHVLLSAWHGSGVLWCVPRQQEKWHLHVQVLWPAAVSLEREIRFGTGWPSFFKPYEESHIKRLRDTSLWDGARRGSVRAVWQSPGARVSGRAAADRGGIASTRCRCRLPRRGRRCLTCSSVGRLRGRLIKASS